MYTRNIENIIKKTAFIRFNMRVYKTEKYSFPSTKNSLPTQ